MHYIFFKKKFFLKCCVDPLMLPHFSVEILLFYSMYHLNMLHLIINVSLGS